MNDTQREIYIEMSLTVLSVARLYCALLGIEKSSILCIPLPDYPEIAYKQGKDVIFNFPIALEDKDFKTPNGWKLMGIAHKLNKSMKRDVAEIGSLAVVTDIFYKKTSKSQVLIIQAMLVDGNVDRIKKVVGTAIHMLKKGIKKHKKTFSFLCLSFVAITLLIMLQTHIKEFLKTITAISVIIGAIRIVKLLKLTEQPAPEYSPEDYYITLGENYVLPELARFCNSEQVFEKINKFDDICDRSNWYENSIFKFFIVKKNSQILEDEMTEMLKFKLEHSINNQLKNPYTCKIVTFDNISPEFCVLSIVDEGGRVKIEVFIANTLAKRAWLINYKSQQQSIPPQIDKNDLEF